MLLEKKDYIRFTNEINLNYSLTIVARELNQHQKNELKNRMKYSTQIFNN